MASPSSPGLLGTLRSLFLRLLAGFGLQPSQKWIAHVVTVALTAGAVALLPLGLSDIFNGAITVLAGIIAHYVVPLEPKP